MRHALALEGLLAGDPVDEVVQLAEPFPTPPWEVGGIRTAVPAATAMVLAWSGKWGRARAVMGAYTEAARREGRLVAVSAGNYFLSEIDRLAGRLAEAEALARTAWEMAKAVDRVLFGWAAIMNLAATLIARGDIAGATKLTRGFDLSGRPPEIAVNPWPIEIRASLQVAAGDLEGGVEDFLALGEALDSRGWLNPAVTPWRQEATIALAMLGRTGEARKVISVAEDRARSFGAAHVIGTVLRARAAIEPRKRQIRTLEESVSALEEYGPPHDLARSLVELGAALRRGGDRS
ncbi:MAG: hypothetical protein LC722_04045, partial [Actinobacteria bacterium]|nr:hypothetical protein [Actinomycetota bacterium]